MATHNESGLGTLSTDAANHVLARAAELDATPAGALSRRQLRESAAEAGISPEAFDTALQEHEFLASTPLTGKAGRVPDWVRICLFGVPDRAAALRYYWIFVAGLLASPLMSRFGSTPANKVTIAVGFAACCFGALWSTSQAVRWLDRHGWQLLP